MVRAHRTSFSGFCNFSAPACVISIRTRWAERARSPNERNKIMKNGTKINLGHYRRILEGKAEEVRRSMSAQKAAQVVARLDCPSDEGDLSQHHHEEWIFLNRNTIDVKH